MRTQTIDPATVTGWGIDADPDNDPTWPMRDRSGEDGRGAEWPRPDLQGQGVEILQSIEHKHRPAVFGTATPPGGLSGMVRRAAFTYSESNWLHWLMLMGADRIDMVEGLASDLARGHIPNIPGEMGLGAAWKHDRAGTAMKLAAVASVATAAVLLLRPRKAAIRPAPRAPRYLRPQPPVPPVQLAAPLPAAPPAVI